MSQQSIFGRISQLARANIHSTIDNAEDPREDARPDDPRLHVEHHRGRAGGRPDHRQPPPHGGRPRRGRRRGPRLGQQGDRREQPRRPAARAGNAAEADRLDNLAKIAIERQIKAEQDAPGLSTQITSQQAVVDKLRAGLEGMKGKLGELKSSRDELVSRQKVAVAQNQMHDSMKSINIADPTSELSRFEDKIRREEARALGNAELAASSLDNQFAELEDAGTTIEVESRLAALKSGQPPGVSEPPGLRSSSGRPDDAELAALPTVLLAAARAGGPGARRRPRAPLWGDPRHAGPPPRRRRAARGLGGAARAAAPTGRRTVPR